jgi:opacity protein-like surface antigen
MKRIGIAVLSAASLLAAGTAAAAEPQWNYGQIGWIQSDGFEDASEGDGFKVDGSIGFLENYHFQLSYEDGTYDGVSADTDWDGYRATLGFHQAISSSGNTQFIANVNYFDIDYDEDGAEGNATADGYGLGFGLRSMISEKVELEGMINWVKGNLDLDYVGDIDYTDTTLVVGGRYHWTQNISTGLSLTLNDSGASLSNSEFGVGGDSALIDLRYSFGSDISK